MATDNSRWEAMDRSDARFSVFIPISRIWQARSAVPHELRRSRASMRLNVSATGCILPGISCRQTMICNRGRRNDASRDPIPPTATHRFSLSGDEVARFHRDGYLGPLVMCSPEVMEETRKQARPRGVQPKGPGRQHRAIAASGQPARVGTLQPPRSWDPRRLPVG